MIDRRTTVRGVLAAIAAPCLTKVARAQPTMSRITAYSFSFPALDGGTGGFCRKTLHGGQYGVAMWLHAAICRTAGIVERVSEPRPDHPRRAVQRFRRTGAGWLKRNRGDGATSLWRHVPDRGENDREGRQCPSVLQMGGRGAAEGFAALELPQIPDRPGWLYRRCLSG